jgi:tRNA uridine 5-carbamoylmethylation protein Kti12
LKATNKLSNVKAEKNNLDLKDSLSEVSNSGKSFIEEYDKTGSCVTESCKKLFKNFQDSVAKAEKKAETVDLDNVSQSSISPDN